MNFSSVYYGNRDDNTNIKYNKNIIKFNKKNMDISDR